jgi:hypothetical protein
VRKNPAEYRRLRGGDVVPRYRPWRLLVVVGETKRRHEKLRGDFSQSEREVTMVVFYFDAKWRGKKEIVVLI